MTTTVKNTKSTKVASTKAEVSTPKCDITTITNTEDIEMISKNKADAEISTAAKTKTRKYEPNDLIPCRSLYAGTLLFTGDKTKTTYEFSNIGDFRYIEYQDLLSGMLRRKKSLYAPYIIIEDDELLEDIHWRDIKKLYESFYNEDDLYTIINLPTTKFKEEFAKLSSGIRSTIVTIVGQLISDGKFDSANKVKIIDEACGTDLKLLML